MNEGNEGQAAHCARALGPGWFPIEEFSAADIFVVAYPKSGSTWFQHLSAALLYGFDPLQAPDALVQELVPDVHYKQFYKRFRTPVFFKSHAEPRADYRRVIYLLRDGRDVMVSHLHHRAAVQDTPITGADALRFVQEDSARWAAHVEAWMANPYAAELITIRYEDLLLDPARVLRRVCDFAGLEREDAALRQVAQQASFANMQRKERLFGWDNPAWPTDRSFVRRGIAGSHRDEMPPEFLECFLAQAGETLRKHGAATAAPACESETSWASA